MRNVLLDTGAIVALLDRSERNHERSVEFLRNYRGRLITIEAVLTEAIHLLRGTAEGPAACLKLVLDGGVTMVPMSMKSLGRCLELMKKYADVPMDFADACLTAVAEELEINEIFTLDRRGFSTYRLPKKKHFDIYP